MANKMLIVLKHEFLQRVKSKSFIILTALGPIIMALLFAIPTAMMAVNTGDTRNITIVDGTGRLGHYFSTAEHVSKGPKLYDAKYELLSATTPKSIDSLKNLVSTKKLSGFFVIPADAIAPKPLQKGSLRLRNPNDFATIQNVEQIYSSAIRTERLHINGIDPTTIDKAEENTAIETLTVSEAGKESDETGGSFVLGYACGFIIYMSILLYGQTIMRSVVEEKSSRVVEIMASSVRPFDLLVGKVLGIGLAACIQVGVWAAMLIVATTFGIKIMETQLGHAIPLHVSPLAFIYFVVYFVGGFLIYSTLYAGIGATAESESDLQQIAMPIMLLVITPILTLMSVIQSPSSTASVVLSLIPFFSPVLMMGRIFSETPPFWQIGLSFVLMAACFFGVLWVAGRIYRVGILMYGKKFTIKEVIKWIRYA